MISARLQLHMHDGRIFFYDILMCAHLRIIYMGIPTYKMHGQTDVYYTHISRRYTHVGLPAYYRSADMAPIAPLWAMLPGFIEQIPSFEKSIVIYRSTLKNKSWIIKGNII